VGLYVLWGLGVGIAVMLVGVGLLGCMAMTVGSLVRVEVA
jgi:hypothetical protein